MYFVIISPCWKLVAHYNICNKMDSMSLRLHNVKANECHSWLIFGLVNADDLFQKFGVSRHWRYHFWVSHTNRKVGKVEPQTCSTSVPPITSNTTLHSNSRARETTRYKLDNLSKATPHNKRYSQENAAVKFTKQLYCFLNDCAPFWGLRSCFQGFVNPELCV